MLNVDLIVPPLSTFKKFLNIPMAGKLFYLYWFPVWYYKKDIEKMGVKIRFLDSFNLKYNKTSKILGISSKTTYFNENIEAKLKKLRKRVDHLIWFDHGDSSGTINSEIIGHVDRYYKRQLLRDLSLYTKKFYKRRVYVDYYVRNYIPDKESLGELDFDFKQEYKQKLGLSWNWAYSDYRFESNLMQYLYNFTRKNKLNFLKPNENRKYQFSANYYFTKNKSQLYFQRENLLKFLIKNYKSNKNVSLGKIPRKSYLKTQRESKAIFSPFSWGEICFRDFETFIAGATLIKPDMDHLNTWPDIFKKNETYIPISWKIEDWDTQIPKIFEDEDLLLKVAKNGQRAYQKLWTEEGKDIFCKRFIEMVTPN